MNVYSFINLWKGYGMRVEGEGCFEYRTAEVRKNTSKFDIPC